MRKPIDYFEGEGLGFHLQRGNEKPDLVYGMCFLVGQYITPGCSIMDMA
jgi:hypothetical protein